MTPLHWGMWPSRWLLPRTVLVFQLMVAGLGLLLLPALIGAVKPGVQSVVALLCAAALLFDLTFTAVGVAWWQRRAVPFNARRVLLVLLSGVLLAAFTLPDARAKLVALALIEPLLLVLVGGVAWQTLRQVRTATSTANSVTSPVEQLQSGLTGVLPRPLARLLAHEVLTWWCLSRHQPVVPLGSEVLTTHRRAGRSVYVWLYVAMEFPVHLALHAGLHGQGGLALWLVTAADALMTLYLVALNRSFERFPTYIQSEQLVLQQGLLWSASIPLAHVQNVDSKALPGARRLTLLVSPNVTLTLSEPVNLTGPWGIQRRAQQISLFVDDPQSLKNMAIPH